MLYDVISCHKLDRLDKTGSNLWNLCSTFAGFRVLKMFKLQFLKSWCFQNIQSNSL